MRILTDDVERRKLLRLISRRLDIQEFDILLDIGCRDGYFAQRIAMHIPNVNRIGCDIQVQKIAKNISYVACDAQHLPFRDSTINKVIMNEVLEHLPNGKLALKEISRVLATKGRVHIATPNSYDHMLKLFRPYARRVDREEGHLKHFSLGELKEICSTIELKIIHHHYDGFFGLFLCYAPIYYIFKPLVKRKNLVRSNFGHGFFFNLLMI